MNNKKKVITTTIIVVVVGILTIIGSFALWTSQIGNNILVAFNTVNPSNYIDYTEGANVFSGNLQATSAYPSGVSGTYTTLKIKTVNNPPYALYAALKLEIQDIDDVLKESRVLKWTVTSKASGTNDPEVVVAESDFVGTTTGDILVLIPSIEVTTTQTDYNVYIWVDSNNPNVSATSGKTIDVDIWMDIYQYRAPKVLDVYCHDDETTVMCNIIDSELLFDGYALITYAIVPNTYTSTSATNYWTSINPSSSASAHYFAIKTSDNRTKYITLNAHREGILYGNDPALLEGLIPITFTDDSGATVKVATNNDQWYNYSSKKWANAVLVTNNGTQGNGTTRDYYLTHPGETIATSDILAYYVWIPRYSYQVWAYSGSNSAGTSREIPIKFVNKNTKEVASAIGDWYTHPAFTFGSTELSGIWVGKFEISHTTLSSSTTTNSLGTCTSASCNNYTGIRILPNTVSLKRNRIGNWFFAARHLEDSGNPFGINASSINANSHMIKNSEWGAAAYLSHSQYGKNEEISINTSTTYTTGCGPNDSTCSTTNVEYGTVNTYSQSTTGNITGIFDMSGGSNEFTLAKYGTLSSNFGSSSGFSAATMTGLDKYVDLYSTLTRTSCTLARCGGHALYETNQWNSDFFQMSNSSNPWYLRGGRNNEGTDSGIFYSRMSGGASATDITSRFVLVEN